MRLLRRVLSRHPASSLAAVSMAAIGIGLLTLALAVLDASRWRPLPFPNSSDVLVLTTSHHGAREVRSRVAWSFPRLQFVQRQAATLDMVSPWRPASVTLVGAGAPLVLRGEFVSASYFSLLGVSQSQGRTFRSDEDVAGSPVPVVVISERLAERLGQAGDPIALGSAMRLNGQLVTVVGMMPGAFRGLTDSAEFWLPTPMAPVLTYPEYLTTNQDFITMLARRREGVRTQDVVQEVGRLADAAYRALPSEDVSADTTISADVVPLGAARIRPDSRRTANLILAGSAVLFLLTGANLLALVIGRAMARRRDSAVALALGATPARLWRAHAWDGAAIVLTGAVVALAAIAAWLTVIGPLDPLRGVGRSFFGTWSAVTLDWRLVACWGAVSLAMSLVAGAGAATWTLRQGSFDDLRMGSRASASTGVSLRRPGLAAALLAIESMLAVILVGTAGQFLESYRRIQGATVGVDAEHVLTFDLQPSDQAVPVAAAPGFIDRVLEEVRRVPGVVSASVDGGAPLAGSASTLMHVIGRPDDPVLGPPLVLRHYVGDEHFATLGVPLKAGRAITSADRLGAPRVVVISESAARQYFPTGDAIGQRVWFEGSTMTSPDESGEIVGIVGDVKYDPLLGERTTASFYTPYRQFTYGWRVYFVKVTGDPRTMQRAIAAAVGRVVPDLPLLNSRPLAEVLGASRAAPQRAAAGTGVLAVLGLVLAVCGIWAVVSHATAQRRKDMAIRIAFGATTANVVRRVMVEGLAWPLLGLAVGLALTVATSGALRALLYGIVPGDPLILLASAGVIALAATGACLLPALRASRVNPIDAMRAD